MADKRDRPIDRDLELEEDTQKEKYLTFTVGKEHYGIQISFVSEIIGIQSITQIPEQPHYVKGIINLRGKIIPVMDLLIRFKKGEREYNDRTCIIVISTDDMLIGFIVDSVSEVISIPDSSLEEPPHLSKECNNQFVEYIGKVDNDIKLILNCNKLLTEEERELL